MRHSRISKESGSFIADRILKKAVINNGIGEMSSLVLEELLEKKLVNDYMRWRVASYLKTK